MRETEPVELGISAAIDSLPAKRDNGGLTDLHDGFATCRRISGWTADLSRMLAIEQAYGHWFLFIPVFLASGVIIWFSLDQTPSHTILGASLLVTGSLYLATRQRIKLLAGVFFIAALCLAGMLLAQLETWRNDTIILDSPVTTLISGSVERREVDARGYWRYIVNVSKTENPVLSRPPEKISVLSRSRHQPIEIGGGITGRVRLSAPSGPALPGLNDFAFSAYFNGIGATGFFYGAPKPLTRDEAARQRAENRGWIGRADVWLYELRSAIAERIRSTIGGDAGAFAASIITDERRAISESTMEALRLSGLAHIVAISGLNMALASGISFVGFRTLLSCIPQFAQRWPVKKIAALAALIMTLCYYLISGFAVSAERAWLMMSIMLIAVLFDRPSISLRNVAISAVVIIVLSPSEVMGPSFQMSFAATIALVSAYAYWSRRRADDDGVRFRSFNPPTWLRLSKLLWTFCAGIVVTSLIGGVSTAIYSMEHFHRVTTYGLAANLAAMPVMSFIVMPFALMAMLLMPFGLDAPFLHVMGYGMSMTIDIAKHVAAWGGDAGVGRQHAWFLGAGTIGLLVLTLFRTGLFRASIIFLAACVYFFITARNEDMPDLIVFEDGKLIGLVAEEQVATTSQRASGFVYDQWMRALTLPEKHTPPVMLDALPEPTETGKGEGVAPGSRRRAMLDDETITAEKQRMTSAVTNTSGAFTCRRNSWCIARTVKGPVVVAIIDNRYLGLACDLGDIAITSRPTSFDSCRSGAVLLSAQTLRRIGSLEIDLAATKTGSENTKAPAQSVIQSMKAALYGSHRPWTRHRYYNWRSRTFDMQVPAPVVQLLDKR